MYTQSILHLKYCFRRNFIFENFIFENFIFRKFYQNLFDFISFYLNLILKISKNFVMNSVHEPGSNGDSKTSPSRKNQVKNQAKCTSTKTGPTGTPRRAHGRVRAVVSWSGPGRVVARDWSYRGRLSTVSWRVRVLLCALCCASCSPSTLYCDTVAQPPSHFGHNTLCVLRYKRPAFKLASVTIHLSVLRYNLFLQYTSCNTKPLKPTLPIAIHYSVLQYTLLTAHPRPPGHNTLTAL